ncbi:Thermostable beta-glucosidase B GH3 [Halomonadaceae bacterium LMG 33818]|uniref:glycoside hydrolase family 3 C-terminal domain-containing protein n=1 Tax=Cernens ardua TaxID=3402176 RepID=UPI003EDC2046
MDTRKLRHDMTLEEKAQLCSGLDFWRTKPIKRLSIKSYMMADGPHGLRQQPKEADHLGVSESNPATCFPTASALACSWDRSLMEQLGKALAREARASQLAIVLGPGINMKRSPLGGRNFEYLSEDPLLAGELASAYVTGMQSLHIGTSLKHFAANNQEHRRMSVDALIEPRTLHELYLAAFERVVKKAHPWTVMCSYNKLNGTYTSENTWLLTDILRHRWGFEGVVMSDWGAINERVDALSAGLDLEMPGGNTRDQLIIEAVQQGTLAESVLDQAVDRLLTLHEKTRQGLEPIEVSYKEHHALARTLATESIVLLKNDANVLPLLSEKSIAVVGDFAQHPRFQGGGSSHVNPTRVESFIDALKDNGQAYTFARGFNAQEDTPDEELIKEAVKLAGKHPVTLVFLGLPDHYESEGYDRHHLHIPQNQLVLMEALAHTETALVVVLANGAPIDMPWLKHANAVITGHLGGQAIGGALYSILFGHETPSAKLAETYPINLSDTPAYVEFPSPDQPNDTDVVNYGENLLIGYRHYDARHIAPLFPFGFGLSYTRFRYDNLNISHTTLGQQESLTIKVDITNIGQRFGKEIVQVYLSDHSGEINVPEKQLRGFDKVALAPGKTTTVEIKLTRRDFAYFHPDLNDWRVPNGKFVIRIGASSRDIRLEKTLKVEGDAIVVPIHRNTLIGDLAKVPSLIAVLQRSLAKAIEARPKLALMVGGETGDDMLEAMGKYLPLRALVSFSYGAFTEDDLTSLLASLNHANRH